MMTTYCKIFHEWSQATNELHEFLEQREQTKLGWSLPSRDTNGRSQFLAQQGIVCDSYSRNSK